MAAPSYTKSALRVSTMVITAHWGTPLQMDTLSESLRSILIPIWYPDVGILKFEHKIWFWAAATRTFSPIVKLQPNHSLINPPW